MPGVSWTPKTRPSKQLGERLKAEVLKEQGPVGDLMLEGPVGDGAPTNPFSSSPQRLLPATATPSPAAESPRAPEEARTGPTKEGRIDSAPTREPGEAWTWQTTQQLAIDEERHLTVTVHVRGVGEAEVITAIAARSDKGPLSRAIAGVQVKKVRRESFHPSLVIDTTFKEPKG